MPGAQFQCQNKKFGSTSQKVSENRNKTFPVMCSFTWKLELVSDILLLLVSGKLFLILTNLRTVQCYFVLEIV